MGQCVSVLLPVLAVERHNLQGGRPGIQAIDIDVETIGIGLRNAERLYAAGLAEIMLGDTCVEGVGVEMIFSGQQLEC